MIVGAAFVPATPLLVPEVAQGAAPELDDLRAACRTAIKRVTSDADRIVLLGAAPERRVFPASTRGSLAGFGVPVEVCLGRDGDGPLALPPSLTVGAWLVRDALGPDTGAIAISVASGYDQLSIPHEGPPTALVVVGDGSARGSTAAPGYYDERAAGFDQQISAALRLGRGELLKTDVELGRELLAAGTEVWNCVAVHVEAQSWDAELLYDAAPYGVGYFVAAWTLRA